jgi:hypothetical protein
VAFDPVWSNGVVLDAASRSEQLTLSIPIRVAALRTQRASLERPGCGL